jgi:GNAT superfamily N-acetyltransferase
MREGVTIAAESPTSSAAQYCLGKYYLELEERFHDGIDPKLSLVPGLDEFVPPQGIFLLVRLNGKPVGCGGFKRDSADAAYLKRMWIAPEARGLGLGKRLLQALEERALAQGYAKVRLETERSLSEAQELYRSSGYVEVPPFNDEPYAHLWFEKTLRQLPSAHNPNG